MMDGSSDSLSNPMVDDDISGSVQSESVDDVDHVDVKTEPGRTSPCQTGDQIWDDTTDRNDAKISQNFPPHAYDGDHMDIDFDVNQINYVQSDVKVEQYQNDVISEMDDMNTDSLCFGDVENSPGFCVKSENRENVAGFDQIPGDASGTPEICLKIENEALFEGKEEISCDEFGRYSDTYHEDTQDVSDQDSDSSSCPSVLEEFSNIPDREQSKDTAGLDSTEMFWPKMAISSSESESHEDVICTGAVGTNVISLDEGCGSVADVPGSIVFKKQKRAESVLCGKVTVLSSEEVNSVKHHVPKEGRLIEILTITEIALEGGIKRFKISYERSISDDTCPLDHGSSILQCHNIVKQIRQTHGVHTINDKVGVVYCGIVLVEPTLNSQTVHAEFQMLYVWKPLRNGSELHLLDIEGLSYILRPFRFVPFRQCRLQNDEMHVCDLLFTDRQVTESDISAAVKQALLQVLSLKMRTTEKCEQILVTGPNTSQKYRKAKYRKRKDAARGGDATKGPKSGRKGSYVIPGQRAATQPHSSETAGVTSGATRKKSVRERLAAVVARRALKRMGREMDLDPESGELAEASGSPSSENSDLTVRNRAMPSKQRTISAGGGVSSEPRAEIEFATVKQEPIDPLAEIESTGVKEEPTEPSDEREAGNANATEMLKAEIELTLSVAGSSDAEVSVAEDDEMDIGPITDEQVKIIMKGKAKEKKRLKNSVSNSANCAPASNRVNWKSIHRGTLTEVSASNAAQAALKASQLNNANKRKIVLNAVVPPSWPKRSTPIILKNAASAKGPSLLPTVLDRMSPSPPGARPDQALVTAVQTQPSSTAANVKLNLNLQLNCKKQNEKYLLQSLPGMLFGNRGKQRMNRNRPTPPSRRPRRTVRELIGGDQMPKIVDVRSEDLSQYSGDELWNKVVGKNTTPGLDDILSRISPSVDKTPASSPCPCSSACDASIDQGPTMPKPALENPATVTGPKILEVHSENLSAYTGDELWSKIIQASSSSQSPCTKSSSVDAVSKIMDNSVKVVQVRPGESIQDKVAKVFLPKRSKHPGFGVRLVDRGVGRLENKKKACDKAEIVWDSIFGRSSKDTTKDSSGTGPSVSDVKVKVETFETDSKAVPLDEKAAGNNSDSDSEQERVLLRADDVPVDPSDEADPGAKQTETILSNSVNLNPSFQGFTNAQPITIHIPLPPRPQPKPQAEALPNKKFFKSARDTKSKFDKGKFIASAIQEAGAKFQVEFPEQVRERTKVKKIGSRVNPRSLTCHDWQRRYAYSLPQGGDVIRKVGIVKEISSANPFLNTCDICGEMFKYSACLRKHIKTHTEFHCDICDCDFQSKKLYDKHIDIFHSFLSDRIKPGKPDNRTNTSDDKDLERYFSFVNGSDEDADRDRELQWQKCYEQNGLVGPGLKLKTEVAVAEDDESLHSSDSDVQDGDVFAPLSNPVSGPSEVEWAKIVAK